MKTLSFQKSHLYVKPCVIYLSPFEYNFLNLTKLYYTVYVFGYSIDIVSFKFSNHHFCHDTFIFSFIKQQQSVGTGSSYNFMINFS